MKFLSYGRQSIDQQDIQEVVKALKGDWLTQGPKVRDFEQAVCRYTGAKYAVAVSHGTAALHLAAMAAELKSGDEAVTTPLTFLSTPNSVCFTGAKPVFADIGSDYNIDPGQIQKKISKKTKAILPVHFSGLPADMEQIAKIARKNKLAVIEDAAHALGAKYKFSGQWIKVGSCRHSDMTCFSFHPVKHITTGEGGVITTNNLRYYEKLRALRTHGVYKTPAMQSKGQWYYEMRELGFNYRITDFQCALGLSQLKKIDGFIKKRRAIVERYNKFFSGMEGVGVIPEDHQRFSSWHLYVLLIDFKRFKKSRKQVVQELFKKNIGTQVHYIPVHLQPYYQKTFQTGPGDCPKAEKYYDQALSIPLYPDLTVQEVGYVCKTLASILGEGRASVSVKAKK